MDDPARRDRSRDDESLAPRGTAGSGGTAWIGGGAASEDGPGGRRMAPVIPISVADVAATGAPARWPGLSTFEAARSVTA
jgi:hypothetical protein